MFSLLVAMLIAVDPSPDVYTVHFGGGFSSFGLTGVFSLYCNDIGFGVVEALYPNKDKTLNVSHRAEFRKKITGADYSYWGLGLCLNEVKGKNPATGLGVSFCGGFEFSHHIYGEIGVVYEAVGQFGGTYRYVCDRNSSPDRTSNERSRYVAIIGITVER
ncbi:MAG: hypothetical protein WC697_00810 [Patescibacteria group bacterium]|jgi:hypothetical protein